MLCSILACALHILIKILENRPIMLALCLMLLLAYYAQNYVGIIGTSLVLFSCTFILLVLSHTLAALWWCILHLDRMSCTRHHVCVTMHVTLQSSLILLVPLIK